MVPGLVVKRGPNGLFDRKRCGAFGASTKTTPGTPGTPPVVHEWAGDSETEPRGGDSLPLSGSNGGNIPSSNHGSDNGFGVGPDFGM